MMHGQKKKHQCLGCNRTKPFTFSIYVADVDVDPRKLKPRPYEFRTLIVIFLIFYINKVKVSLLKIGLDHLNRMRRMQKVVCLAEFEEIGWTWLECSM